MKSIFVVVVAVALLVVPFSGYSQSVSIKKIIATAQTDYSVSAQQQKTGILKKASSGVPFVRSFELRARNDAFWEENMRYSFRVSPKGWGEEGAERNLFKAEKKLTEQEVQLELHDALLLRYTAVVEFFANQVMNQLYKELIVVLEDRIKVLEKSNITTDFDLTNILLAEDDLTKLNDQNIQTDKDMRMYLWKIREFLVDTSFIGFDTNNIVDVESVSQRVKAASLGPDTDNVRLNNFRLKYFVSEGKYQLQKAADRRYVSFASFTYDYGAYINENIRRLQFKSYDLNARYSVDLGLGLPFLTADGRDNARRESAVLGDKVSFDLAKRDLVEKTARDIRDVEALITHYHYLLSRQNEVNVQGSLQKYLQMNGINPLMLLSIKQGLLENKVRIEKTRFDIYRNYLQILDETSQLTQLPLVNYLSMSKEPVSP
jgi:hypothetical protein